MTRWPTSARIAVWTGVVAALALGVYALRSAADGRGAAWTAPPVAVRTFPGGGRLFVASLALAACATILALALGFPVGVHLGKRGRAALAGLVLVPLVIPPHLAAYVWRFALEDVAGFLVPGWALWRSPAWSFLGAAWTLAAIYWPVIALAVAVGMRLRGTRLEQELATLAPPRAVFWRAVVPGLAPALAAGMGVFFLLALANYGVPLMWNVPSQNVAVFQRLTEFYSVGEALVLSIPLQAAALGLCLLGLIWLARRPYGIGLGGAGTAPRPAVLRRQGLRPAIVTGLVLLLTVAVPVIALGAYPGLFKALQADLEAGRWKFFWGLVLGVLGASGATVLGLALAHSVRRARRPFAVLVEVVGLWAFFAPAAVVCMIFAGLLNRPGVFGAIYDSLAIFVLVYGLRFFYIPWKVLRFQQRFEGREHGETVRLLGLGRLARARLALAGPRRPAVCVSWLLVFALVLGELEIAAFLVQPGRQPISVFLDNLMHYGRSTTVIKWSFIVVATEIAVAWIVLSLGLSQWRKLRVAR